MASERERERVWERESERGKRGEKGRERERNGDTERELVMVSEGEDVLAKRRGEIPAVCGVEFEEGHSTNVNTAYRRQRRSPKVPREGKRRVM